MRKNADNKSLEDNKRKQEEAKKKQEEVKRKQDEVKRKEEEDKKKQENNKSRFNNNRKQLNIINDLKKEGDNSECGGTNDEEEDVCRKVDREASALQEAQKLVMLYPGQLAF